MRSCKADLVLMDGAQSAGNVSLLTARALGRCQWAAALAQGLASALSASRDHRTVCPLHMGAGLSQSPAAPPHTSPSASSRLFSFASSYLFKRKKTAAAQPFTHICWREGLALSSSLFSRKTFLQICCVENKMTFFSSHALALVCKPRHAAMGRAGQLSTHNLTPALQTYI